MGQQYVQTERQFSWPVRVYYEDTDAAGVVYYANYLKFMERARTEWLRTLGAEQDQLKQDHGVVFVVRSVQLDYKAPARFNDKLRVVCDVRERSRVSITFGQQVCRADDANAVLCAGEVMVVCVDAKNMRVRPIPQHLLTEIPNVD